MTALVDAIKADYQRVTGSPLRVFFDTHDIGSMDLWEARILTGLRQSKMMVAILSPSYFASAYCLKEWEIYVETELAQAVPGEGITPIYVVRHPAFEADQADGQLRHWIKDLKRRQYIKWLPFWPQGRGAAAGGRPPQAGPPARPDRRAAARAGSAICSSVGESPASVASCRSFGRDAPSPLWCRIRVEA